ncbi:MAG TPA: flagellar assembly peptidoglycan hydrolase FlgJ [Burkholderiales bacterium]|nr:flagellar assembly peptidoglycan hydrolase FlgJ [Burkholderiales bacterium]
MAIGNDPAAVILATDSPNLEALRLKARTDPKSAVKETARQFEALLMNTMLKSMRETVAQDGMFDSEQTRLYTSMLDQHLAEAMSKRGIGLAQVLERQLSSNAGKPIVSPTLLQATPPGAPAESAGARTPAAERTRSFIERHAADASAVSAESGIPASYLIGQAALETGWGRSEIRANDGTASHNLFGIKAGPGWQGRTVDVTTTEYSGGTAARTVQTFRAYDSYADSFRDYAGLLASNARYAQVLKNTDNARAYARELQRAGYATDPHYADKLANVIEGNTAQRARRA